METNNIFLKPGQVFRVVSPNEILKADHLIREMYESPMLSENGGWDTAFKLEGWRGTAWHTAKDEIPYWVGKTLNDLNSGKLKYHYEIIEIVNGNK